MKYKTRNSVSFYHLQIIEMGNYHVANCHYGQFNENNKKLLLLFLVTCLFHN